MTAGTGTRVCSSRLAWLTNQKMVINQGFAYYRVLCQLVGFYYLQDPQNSVIHPANVSVSHPNWPGCCVHVPQSMCNQEVQVP